MHTKLHSQLGYRLVESFFLLRKFLFMNHEDGPYLHNALQFIGVRQHVVDDAVRGNLERLGIGLRKPNGGLVQGPPSLLEGWMVMQHGQ
jgi:hypothetical protein